MSRIRDNLFVIYAVINDTLGYQKVEVDIQFYDLSQAFDSMWYEETMNDMWEESLEVKDDKFSLIRTERWICSSKVYSGQN